MLTRSAWPRLGTPRKQARRRSRGLSLVEMMVGVAIGLFIVAGAALMVSTQLADSRKLLIETQIQQDLRAAADIVTRELRRAGGWVYQDSARYGVSNAGAPPVAAVNPFQQMAIAHLATNADAVTYTYNRTQNSNPATPYGFKLVNGVLSFNIEGGGYQDLTDSHTINVTTFTVSEFDGPSVTLPCTRECTGGGTACWPQYQVRQLTVEIVGQAVSDPSVVRRLVTVAKLRNNRLTSVSASQVCP